MSIINKRLSLICLLGLMSLALLWGCDIGPEAAVVDFSKTENRPQLKGTELSEGKLRVAIGAMISPKETLVYYQQLLDYLGETLGVRVEFVQRKTYEEVNRLFETNSVDLGLICSGPYASAGAKYGMELIAAPQVRGKGSYQAYLIVNSQSEVSSLEDLKGKVFAFTDPDSNTGHLVPVHWLSRVGETPDTFFKESLFTYSHDNSILAVSRNLVDGATVDGLIWEYYQAVRPVLTGKTRVIRKSDHFGMPPVVVRRNLPKSIKRKLSDAILNLHNSAKGQAILGGLMIDRFVEQEDSAYSTIRKMKADLDAEAEKS